MHCNAFNCVALRCTEKKDEAGRYFGLWMHIEGPLKMNRQCTTMSTDVPKMCALVESDIELDAHWRIQLLLFV